MATIYLVRHASPSIQPGVPTRDWTLSEDGVREAQVLAGAAESWGIEALYSSSEAKARSTALIIGDALGLPVNVAAGFDELHMPDWIANADEFNETVRNILTGEPLHRGTESAASASARFAETIALVLQGAIPAAVVSHGRILTSYLAAHAGLEDPFDFWRSIPMPGWCQIELERGRVRLVSGFNA